jgi:hypothetical protein
MSVPIPVVPAKAQLRPLRTGDSERVKQALFYDALTGKR